MVTSPFASRKLVRELHLPDTLNITHQPPATTKASHGIQDLLVASGATRGKKKGWRAKEHQGTQISGLSI